MIFTCFFLDSYTTDAEIPMISQLVEAPSSEDAAETYVRRNVQRWGWETPSTTISVVVCEGNRKEVWEVTQRITCSYETECVHEIEEGEAIEDVA